MTAPVHQPQSYTDFQGLTKLRVDAKADEQAALRTVAEQFEGIFMGMMLKSMRDASIGDQLFDSNAQDTFMDMYDKELVTGMASDGGIGLADVIVRQLSRTSSSVNETSKSEKPFQYDDFVIQNTPQTVPAVTQTAVEVKSPSTTRFESPEQFVRELWPLAKQTAKEMGVDPKVLISQAALETGWGARVSHGRDGQSSYNLFNIKADHRWQGESVSISTLEYQDGIPVQQRAAFRAYDSYEESFKDYAAFISHSPRYGDAMAKADDAVAYVEALQQGGYATDPHYADKIKDIMKRDLFHIDGV